MAPQGKVDGNTVRTQRTRARVLAEGLRLFNELGEANVTTGMIAEALDMSPGNLYYHFRNKDQIVEHLFRDFAARVGGEPVPRGRGVTAAIEDLWFYLHLMLEGIWEYRFLYRNLDDLAARDRRLRERFNRIAERKFRAVVSVCEALVRARAMRATPEEIRALAVNVLVVATYWLNFRSLSARREGAAAGDLGLGAYHVMALVAPYLLGAAREHLELLSLNYLE